MNRVYSVPVPGKDYSLEFCIDSREYFGDLKQLALVKNGPGRYVWEYDCECVGDDDGVYLGAQVSIKDGFLRVLINVEGKKKFTFAYDIQSSDFLDSPLVPDQKSVTPDFSIPEDISCTGSCTFKDKRTPLSKPVMQQLLSILRM